MKLISRKALFSPKGRINEWTYLFYIVWWLILYYILFYILVISLWIFLGVDFITQNNIWIQLFLIITYRIIIIINGIKRFHDRWKSVWRMLTLLIPIWGIVIGCKLMFSPWEKWKNKYWKKTKEVSKTTKTLTIVFLLLYLWILILRSSI